MIATKSKTRPEIQKAMIIPFFADLCDEMPLTATDFSDIIALFENKSNTSNPTDIRAPEVNLMTF